MYLKQKYFPFALFVLILLNTQVFSQTAEFKSKFEDADYYFLFEEYSKSMKIYLELYELDKANANINYLLGICYLQSISDKEKLKSIPFLEFASKNIDLKYKEGKYKETKAPSYSLYYLAYAYRLNNEFNKAIDTYRVYIKNLNSNNRSEIQSTLKEIEYCYNAIELIQVPVNLESVKNDNFTVENEKTVVKRDSSNVLQLEDYFVKATSEQSFPIVSSDENLMVFSMGITNVFPQEVQFLNFDFDEYKTDDLYFTVKKSDGTWDVPVNIMTQLKAKAQLAPVCLSHDGKTLYLVQDDNDDGNIYSSKFENGNWQPMVKVKGDINSGYWESHASLSPDDKVMYFTSARKGGFGGLDIYYSKLNDKGEWGKAVNLGAEINTKEDEETPFILPDGKTLFFSSKGHKSMGGFDIFSSFLNTNKMWSKPLNVGYSINTVNNDFAYINKINKTLAYSPLNRSDLRSNFSNQPDKDNSYKLVQNTESPVAPAFSVKGIVVFNTESGPYPESFDISVIDSVTGKKVTNIDKTDLSGEYSFKTTSGVYYVKYSSPGYKELTQRILVPEIYTPTTIMIITELVPDNAEKNLLSQAEIIFDYKKNFPELDKTSKINVQALKNKRDSLKLLAEAKNNTTNSTTNTTTNNNNTANNTNSNQQISETKNNNSALTGKTVVTYVFFDFNKYIPTEFRKNLDNLAYLMIRDKSCKIQIEGHSDSRGDEYFKQLISDKRAEYIKNYLLGQGVSNNNLKTKGYSSNKLIAKEEIPEINKYNRRAEFKIMEGCQSLYIEPLVISDDSKSTNSETNSSSNGEIIISNLFFEFDSVHATNESELEKLAAYLIKNPSCIIEVIGHSDAQGVEVFKKYVSEERAKNIREKLIQKGVKAANIQAKGVSDSEQIAINNSSKTRKYNRRVEFKIIQKGNQKLIIEPVKVPPAYQLK